MRHAILLRLVPALVTLAAPATLAAQHGQHQAMRARHLRETPTRPATPDDRRRADALVDTLRRAIARYRDVRVAEAEGFRAFAPRLPQGLYHYTHRNRALAQRVTGFDAAEPASLLYRKERDGTFTLVGAMYTAPADASLEELDRRVPLSIARWHLHVNLCVPRRAEQARWTERRDGQPVFGPRSPIATRAACEAVGGRFREQAFGWMVHVQPFETDPARIWGDHHGPATAPATAGDGHAHGH